MKLKRSCRTCKYLNPSMEDDGYYDYEENWISYPRFEMCANNPHIDEVNNVCNDYESINIEEVIDND